MGLMVEREREEAKTETAMIQTLQESVEDLRSKVGFIFGANLRSF